MLTEDTVKLLQRTNAESIRPVVVSTPAEPPHVYRLFKPIDGSIEKIIADPKPRAYLAHTLDGLAQAVGYLAGLDEKRPIVVMVGPGMVRAIIGEDERREFVAFTLKESECFRLIKEGELDEITQADLLWALRSEFNNCVAPESFVPALKQIKFKMSSDGQSEVSQGRESMGKSVLRELAGASDLPEDVELSFTIYTNVPDFAVDVQCAVRIHLEGGVFTLKPIGDAIDVALENTHNEIAKMLREKLGTQPNISIWSGASMV